MRIFLPYSLKCQAFKRLELSQADAASCLKVGQRLWKEFEDSVPRVSEGVNINVALFSYTRAFGDVPLNHPSPNYHTQREDVSALDRFDVHHTSTRRVFSGTGFERMP
ncbi:hypothetical protein TNCV_2607641 [Trichonephila clavipes]|uniref:Uncharacterized protein n=1 Tax=Trichonephila clavipes TaxID=2585209 RepID=A0A8X6VCZ0_TRICX|nr:hypothetical protein TNCV_2607641 [Trichonephila clavipes]